MGKRRDIKALPSLERLNELFGYDSITGDLLWKSVPANAYRAKVGERAGTVGRHGYCVVGVERTYFYVHRIVWKMMTGADPLDQIDHIDGDRRNNRWANIRQADNGQNRCNTKLHKNNTSGAKGVSWDASRQCWAVSINSKRIGRFKSKEIAIIERAKAAEILHGAFLRIA